MSGKALCFKPLQIVKVFGIKNVIVVEYATNPSVRRTDVVYSQT